MVAAGTGAITPITLWVSARAATSPPTSPGSPITEDQLVWDWDTSSSNYSELKQAGFNLTNGKGWLVEDERALLRVPALRPADAARADRSRGQRLRRRHGQRRE